jgi:nucleoside-diphosphate-sugar epimerase
MPARLFSLLAGRYSVYLFDEQPAVSNARATAALGWRPQFPDWHDGFASVFS